MLGWFQALMPREERFFDLFAPHAETVVAGAEALRALLEGGEAVPQHCQTIMDHEHDADDITREVLIAVRRTFITPFDRGDIKDLITSMDDAIDQMQKTAKAIMLFEQRAVQAGDARDGRRDRRMRAAWCARRCRCCARSAPMPARLNEHHRGDHAARGPGRRAARQRPERALSGQRARPNPMAFIVGAEIYDHLEKVVDRFEDVANQIHGIVHRARLSSATAPIGHARHGRDSRSRLPLLIALIVVALVFDFLNGLHDAANSIATIVSTRVLRAAVRGRLGGVLQLHRLPVLRPARGADGRHRHHVAPTSSIRA